MKIRLGFVSNSSTSSFILGFRKTPTCVLDVCRELYPNLDGVAAPYSDFGERLDASTASQLVWDQIKDQSPMHRNDILEEIKSGFFDGYPEYNFSEERLSRKIENEYKKKTGKCVWDPDADKKVQAKWRTAYNKEDKAWKRKLDKAAKKFFDSQIERFKGKKCFRVEFGDSTPTGATMEHGNAFVNVETICISHH